LFCRHLKLVHVAQRKLTNQRLQQPSRELLCSWARGPCNSSKPMFVVSWGRRGEGPAAAGGLVRHAQGQRRLQLSNRWHGRAVGVADAGAPRGAGGHHRRRSLAGTGLAMRMCRLLEKLRFGSQTFLLYATQTRQCISRLGRDCWRQS